MSYAYHIPCPNTLNDLTNYPNGCTTKPQNYKINVYSLGVSLANPIQGGTWTLNIAGAGEYGITAPIGTDIYQVGNSSDANPSGTLELALQNSWTIAIDPTTITEAVGVRVTQANGYMTWTMTINAATITKSQGVVVTQSGATGTLTTALTGAGTTVTITSAIGQVFDTNDDLVIDSAGTPTTVLAADVTNAASVTTADATGTLKTALTGPVMTSVAINCATGVVFNSTTNLVVGVTTILAADQTSINHSGKTTSINISFPYHAVFVAGADCYMYGGSTLIGGNHVTSASLESNKPDWRWSYETWSAAKATNRNGEAFGVTMGDTGTFTFPQAGSLRPQIGTYNYYFMLIDKLISYKGTKKVGSNTYHTSTRPGNTYSSDTDPAYYHTINQDWSDFESFNFLYPFDGSYAKCMGGSFQAMILEEKAKKISSSPENSYKILYVFKPDVPLVINDTIKGVKISLDFSNSLFVDKNSDTPPMVGHFLPAPLNLSFTPQNEQDIRNEKAKNLRTTIFTPNTTLLSGNLWTRAIKAPGTVQFLDIDTPTIDITASTTISSCGGLKIAAMELSAPCPAAHR